MYSDNQNNDQRLRYEQMPNITPELTKIVRKLLPKELPLNVHVRDVEYIESGCEHLTGTLYMTTFRLVFAPDNELENNNIIISGNRYIGEYDIPLTSIQKVNVGPVDTQSGFTSYLTDNQSRSETRTFSILTRDFRYITYSKVAVTKSNSIGNKSADTFAKMETYIDALKSHSRFQDRGQLYPWLAMNSNGTYEPSSRSYRSSTFSAVGGGRSMDEEIGDFCMSSDERIRSYLTLDDWRNELFEADERYWKVNSRKFNRGDAQTGGPYVCLASSYDQINSDDLVWHWTHTSEATKDYGARQSGNSPQYMLITIAGIGEITTAGEPLRRNATDVALVASSHYIQDQPFNRYNLAKFPCNLQRLQTSYKKLVDVCVLERDEDDDKWLSKLNGTKWLKYVSKALHGAASIAKLLSFKNIQLAGSDTDNNCLMASLIQILLRPKCRTIKGFCELIVKEWLIREHRFLERFGQVLYDIDGHPAQEGPVFLLFLDCVHQLIVQNPFAFEFTDQLLIELYLSICHCYHHTFVHNYIQDRLQAIRRHPHDLLVLSAFDFTLYLNADFCRLLKNEASVFTQEQIVAANRNINRTRTTTSFASPHSHEKSRSPGQSSRRSPYQLESPRLPNFVLDLPSSNGVIQSTPEQYEYDTIEAPQKFPSNLSVDWRAFNLELWAKCYCRYDRDYFPTANEQQLLMEISRLKDDAAKAKNKFKRNIVLDAHHSTNYANSWHPVSLDTRV